jgi:hypothetical protein
MKLPGQSVKNLRDSAASKILATWPLAMMFWLSGPCDTFLSIRAEIEPAHAGATPLPAQLSQNVDMERVEPPETARLFQLSG